MNAPETAVMSSEIRKRGFKRVILAGGLFAVNVALLLWLGSKAHAVNFPIVGMSLPLALTLIGGIELVTGAPFQRLANSWMSLRGWQRGVLGTLIVFASLAMILCVVTFVVMMFT
jgi:hypothetical protein